jgi:branched-chain amino acid transport system substrate-binding protein
VRARWLGLAAVAAASGALGGCGGVAVSSTTVATGPQLAVYSSLPLQGPAAAISQQLVGGEKLALADAGGRAGRFKVGYVSLDDSGTAGGPWNPGVTATNAKTAAQDTSTIAYLGDLDSAATAISLPLTNAAGILQVSPASPYVGLTSSLFAGQDEPGRFYLSGKRTFGRLQPGDTVQAAAQVSLMRSLGVRRLYVIDDQDPFRAPLADLVAADARRAGIVVPGHDSMPVAPGGTFAGEAQRVAESHADAVFFAGAGTGAVGLWQALHASDPRLLLLGSSALDDDAFASAIGDAGAVTYLTTPALPDALYPPAAERVLAEYRRAFGGEVGAYALYGYEAMSVVLDAIRAAGSHGNDRQAVIDRFFAVRERPSVLGRYSIQPDGETTLSRYGSERVVGGRRTFYRAFDVTP